MTMESSNEIPLFPNFKDLNLQDQNIFKNKLEPFDPYSDFNFISFYSWNTADEHKFSILNDNLVICLSDYVSGAPVFSILGTNNIAESLNELISYSRTISGSTIKLIPQVVADVAYSNDKFNFSEDQNNSDYIFSLQELAELQGKKFASKRHSAQKCLNENSSLEIVEISEIDFEIIKQIKRLVMDWQESKKTAGDTTDHSAENTAISILLETKELHNQLRVTCAYLNKELVGFSIDELLPKKYVLSHYFKVDTSIRGLSELLNKTVAKNLSLYGYELWNWEQDLGIEGLKKMKLGYRPTKQLKKYQLSRST